jgi:hypothetical protein
MPGCVFAVDFKANYTHAIVCLFVAHAIVRLLLHMPLCVYCYVRVDVVVSSGDASRGVSRGVTAAPIGERN